MFELIKYEIRKLLLQRFAVVVFLALACVNILLCVYSVRNIGISAGSYSLNMDGYDKYIKERITSVIDNADTNLTRIKKFNGGTDSFAYRYQGVIAEKYTRVLDNAVISDNEVSGWNIYFNYGAINIITCIFVLITVCFVFVYDKSTGIYQIIYVTKNGTVKTCAAKLTACFIAAVGAALVYNTLSFAVISVMHGFSAGNYGIQSMYDFILSPYLMSLFEFLLVTVVTRALTFAALALVTSVTAVLTYNYFIALFTGGIIWAAGFVISRIEIPGQWIYLNFYSVIENYEIFKRYRAVSLNSNVVPITMLYFILIGIILILSSAAVIYIFTLNPKKIGFKYVSSIISKIKENRPVLRKANKKASSHRYTPPLSLLYYEHRKVSGSYLGIFICIVLILEVYTSVKTYTEEKSYKENLYREYMYTLSGELSEDKIVKINAETEAVASILQHEKEMTDSYFKGEISVEEFKIYTTELNDAVFRGEILLRINNDIAYLKQKELESGIKGRLIYNTDIKSYLIRDFDVLLYIITILAATGIFTREYSLKNNSSPFVNILHAAKNGRGSTYMAKIKYIILFTASMYLLTNAPDLIFILSRYNIADLSAPLISIDTFSATVSSVTVGQYMLIIHIVRLAAYIALAVICVSLSIFMKNTVTSLFTALIISLVPYAFNRMGITLFAYCDCTALLSGYRLYMLSSANGITGGWGLLILYILIWLTIPSAFSVLSYRRFVR